MTTYQLVSGLSGLVDWSDPEIWVGGIVPGGPDADVVLENSAATPTEFLQIGNSDPSDETVSSLDVGQNILLESGDQFPGESIIATGPVTIEGGIYLLSPALLRSPDITISRTGSIFVAGSATLAGSIQNDGVIDTVPGDVEFTIAQDLSGAGTIDLGGDYSEMTSANFRALGASVTLDGSDTNNVEFDVPLGSLTLDSPASFSGTIYGFAGPVLIEYKPNDPYDDTRQAPGNEIVLEAVSVTSIVSETYTGDATSGVLALGQTDGTTLDLHFAGQYDLADFAIAAGPDGTSTVITDTVIDTTPCFATGTRIATPSGPSRVEDLTDGGQVLLADGGQATIRWIGHRRQQGGIVVRVGAHALGHNVPDRDLIVSTDHGLYLRGVLVQAGLLVDGTTIRFEDRHEVTFWHVELDRHAILLAEGAPAESYLDIGNRRRFANCALGYDPIVDAASHEPCAEMVFAGERLDRLRAALPARARQTV